MLAAARDPRSLAVGVDASADAMRRAARRVLRSRASNVLFVVAAVEALPPELAGIADLVTVHFPWGSLLRGVLTAEELVLANLASLARPGAEVRLLVSTEPRDGAPPSEAGTFLDLAPRYRRHGLELIEARAPTVTEIAASHSSWAKRLRAAERRRVTLARLRRSG